MEIVFFRTEFIPIDSQYWAGIKLSEQTFLTRLFLQISTMKSTYNHSENISLHNMGYRNDGDTGMCYSGLLTELVAQREIVQIRFFGCFCFCF